MQDDNIKKSPYKGIVIYCTILLAVPVLIYFLFKYIIVNSQPSYGYELNKYTAMFLGFGTGFLFQLSCIIAGLFKGTLRVIIKRVVNFCDNLTISFKFACKIYHDEFIEDGAVFWILLVVVGSTLYTSIHGLICFIKLISM